jgi:hypothetical protein
MGTTHDLDELPSLMQKMIETDRQLAWWITRCRRRWGEDGQVFWTVQVNTTHWSALWLSKTMLESLRAHRQISKRYRVRIISRYADLPMRLEVDCQNE